MVAALLAQAEEAEESLKVLPDTDELIWGSLFFLVLLFALVKFVFPKLKVGLAQRSDKIRGQIEEAERTRREADDILEQYRAQLADARTEAQRIIDEGKRTAESLKADLVAKAEQQAQEIVRRAQVDVSGERDRVIQSLRTTLGDLSIQLAGRVIERELTSSEAHRALVDRAIDDLAVAGNGHPS